MDDSTIFPNVARISDLMLKLMDPKNQLLVKYSASINTSHPTWFLPQKGVEETSKASKASKKKKPVDKPQSVDEEIVKETIPTKTRVLKRMQKPAKKYS